MNGYIYVLAGEHLRVSSGAEPGQGGGGGSAGSRCTHSQRTGILDRKVTYSLFQFFNHFFIAGGSKNLCLRPPLSEYDPESQHIIKCH